MEIIQITDKVRKLNITRNILESLETWFGIEDSREQYILESKDKVFFCAFDNEQPVGFVYLNPTGKDTMEIVVIGVLEACHRQGIGRCLIERAIQFAKQQHYSFLQVKTVKSGIYESYDQTNAFYQALGFKEFEVIPSLWDEWNPCQIYVMAL